MNFFNTPEVHIDDLIESSFASRIHVTMAYTG